MIDRDFWRRKRVFLTGHSGFKGSWACVWLERLGAEVTGYALEPPTRPSLFEVANVSDLVADVRGDIRDKPLLEKSMKNSGAEIVIHMAAQPIVRESYRDPLCTYETNVLGTANVLDAARACPAVRALLVVTTDKVYENREWCWGYRESEPLGGYDPYSASKACAEIITASYRSSFFNPIDYGKKHGTAIASARAGNVIGGGDWAADRLIPDCIRAIERGEKIRIRNPNAIRPWQHVLEPLSGYFALCELLYRDGVAYGEAWNFGPDESDAKSVEWVVTRICEKWPDGAGFLVDEGEHPHEANYLKLDCSKARARLGWAPQWDLATALASVVEWNLALRNGRSALDITREQIELFENSKRDS